MLEKCAHSESEVQAHKVRPKVQEFNAGLMQVQAKKENLTNYVRAHAQKQDQDSEINYKLGIKRYRL